MAMSTTTDESSTGALSTFGAGGGESAKSTEPSESSEATEDAAEGTGENAPVADCSLENLAAFDQIERKFQSSRIIG